jgi:hypothetical protein
MDCIAVATGACVAFSMIIEFFQSLRSSAPQYARAMGYVRESTAIRARYKRCYSAWESHTAQSRALCLQALEYCTHFKHCAVLGAGLLFDVPLAELSARFQRVTLVDIVFSEETRAIADSFANVFCCEWDCTGCVNTMYESVERAVAGQGQLALPTPTNALREIFAGEHLDFIMSASIVSQLAIMPTLYAEERGVYRHHSESEWQAWKTALIEAHIRDIQSQAQCVCVVFDQERMILKQERHNKSAVSPQLTVIDRESAIGTYSKELLIQHFAHTHTQTLLQEWYWDIAPLGEEHKHYAVRHRVGGVIAW